MKPYNTSLDFISYADLRDKAMEDLSKAKTCCNGRQRIIRKYIEIARSRKKIENERYRSFPNSAERGKASR